MTNEKILRRNIVVKRTGLARSTIYSMMAQGRFPMRIKIGKRAVAWRESEIDEYIASPSSWWLKNLAIYMHAYVEEAI